MSQEGYRSSSLRHSGFARKIYTMRNSIILLLSFTYVLLSTQCKNEKAEVEGNSYHNPIFAGDYPDPSILVDGEDYYIVHSSFEYYPGLTIYHSKDLVNWTPVASALNKYIGSVWAPDLVKYKNKYYIYFPANNTNYVVVADSITGPWSEPIDLNIGNIDPGHIADGQGNRYLYFSNGGYVSLSEDGLTVTSELQHAYDGWPIPREWTIECFCMEGPKLFKRGAYYYLIVAQGGTAGPATGHMVVSARSKSPLGPWENSPYNPIVRTVDHSEQWHSVGHGTVFEGVDKNWWMIFHGYEKDFYNMGRQTLLAPIEWTEDGWFKLPQNLDITQPIALPSSSVSQNKTALSDDFSGKSLNDKWKFYGEYDPSRFYLENNTLVVQAKGSAVADCSPLLLIPSEHSYTAEVEIETEGDAIGGLILFYSKKIASGILADKSNILANLRGWQFATEKDVIDSHVYLRLRNENHIVDMFYSLDGEKWVKIENSADVSAYHHNVLSDFLSLRIGLVSMGEGNVKFSNFKYEPIK